jgi:hypothetical protein
MFISRNSKKILPFLVLLIASETAAQAQSKGKGTVKGRVLNQVSKSPFHDLQISLLSSQQQTAANEEGYFTIVEAPAGNQQLIINGPGVKSDTIGVNIGAETVTDIGEIFAKPGEQPTDNAELPTITLDENTSQEDENSSSSSQSSVGFYAANNDPFLYTASFVFGPYRFKPRGYDNADVEINGVPLQDLESGYASTTIIGGLNDVLRDRNITYGLKPAEYSFGTVKGSTYISATAADQRVGTNVSYQLSNGSYHNRVMLTHSSGISKKGWAYSFSGSKRWAKEGYIPGTFYDAYSFYGAVSKVTDKGQLNLTAFGAPSTRGKATAETAETFDIAGSHYYSAAWGYQNGEKRNALIGSAFQPVVVANYAYKPTDKTRWNTALGYEFGKRSNTNIDFYHGYSPNPTYYKNMPNYYLNGDLTPNTAEAAAIADQYKSHPELLQVQWDNLINSNRLNVQTLENINGIAGNNFTGKQSIYVTEKAIDDLKKLSFNSNITHVVNEHITLNGGLMAISQQDEYYKQLDDLLGGDYFVNYNQFADLVAVGNPAYVQNNLNKPNEIIRKNDKYGYDYILRALQTKAFGQGIFTYNQVDFFLAAEGGSMAFSREGLMRNGLFPDNSFGRSATHTFGTYKVKGGLTYNLNPKNSVYAHAAFFGEAPKIDYTYVSDKGRDYIVDGAKVYNTKSLELGYIFKSPVVNFRLTGYVTDVTGNTIVKRFWNDDPAFNSFVNFVMQNVNTRSTGIEFVAGGKISKQLSVTAVAAIGQSFYTDNPDISVYLDNSPLKTPTKREVYIKNYYLGVGPQSIYSLAFKYSPKNYWHVNLTLNYMDNNYVEVNPERRTQQATDLVTPGSAQWHAIVDQEKMPGAFTADVSIGKSFNIGRYVKLSKNRNTLNLNVGVNNLLNNENIKITGFEQLRYDFAYRNPAKFPNKYAYGYGTTFFITLSYRF